MPTLPHAGYSCANCSHLIRSEAGRDISTTCCCGARRMAISGELSLDMIDAVLDLLAQRTAAGRRRSAAASATAFSPCSPNATASTSDTLSARNEPRSTDMRHNSKVRMNRLFGGGRCLDVAIDHGVCNEPSFLNGLEDIAGRGQGAGRCRARCDPDELRPGRPAAGRARQGQAGAGHAHRHGQSL